MNNMGKFVIIVGLLCLMHAAYSIVQHRLILQFSGQEFYLPADIIIQTLFSHFLLIWGVTFVVKDFKEIKATSEVETKSCEILNNRPSFYVFNSRFVF